MIKYSVFTMRAGVISLVHHILFAGSTIFSNPNTCPVSAGISAYFKGHLT